MLKNERDNYIKFYEAFGEQLKYANSLIFLPIFYINKIIFNAIIYS